MPVALSAPLDPLSIPSNAVDPGVGASAGVDAYNEPTGGTNPGLIESPLTSLNAVGRHHPGGPA